MNPLAAEKLLARKVLVLALTFGRLGLKYGIGMGAASKPSVLEEEESAHTNASDGATAELGAGPTPVKQAVGTTKSLGRRE